LVSAGKGAKQTHGNDLLARTGVPKKKMVGGVWCGVEKCACRWQPPSQGGDEGVLVAATQLWWWRGGGGGSRPTHLPVCSRPAELLLAV